MNRAKEYTNFAGWFAGLGYIVLWPVTSTDLSDKPFGASIFCRDNSFSVTDLLCNTVHPLQLPAALHVLGFASALFVTVRLLIYAIKCARRRRGNVAPPAAPIAPHPVAAVLRPRLRTPPPPPLRPVKPRAHFGLRNVPRGPHSCGISIGDAAVDGRQSPELRTHS